MTAQINDDFLYNEHRFNISAIEFPEKFFDVKEFGVKPVFVHTACWRGYLAEFSILNGTLILKNFNTNSIDKNYQPIAINGVLPKVYKRNSSNFSRFLKGNVQYKDLNMVIPYNGRVLITDVFIRERYVHMGFHSPLNYVIVIELTFDNGMLTNSVDLSDVVAILREKQELEPEGSKYSRLPSWIEDSFDLSYDKKFNFK